MKRTKVKVQRSISPDGNAQAESWAIGVDETLKEGSSEGQVTTQVSSNGTSSQSGSQSRAYLDK
jgi:hypothetical protein